MTDFEELIHLTDFYFALHECEVRVNNFKAESHLYGRF